MTGFPRFSASFLLAAAVLALLLSAHAVAASSNKDEKQAEYLVERDLQRSYPAKRQSLPPSKKGKSNVAPTNFKRGQGGTFAPTKFTKLTPRPSVFVAKSAGVDFTSTNQKKLATLANQVAGAQAGFKFCSVDQNYATTLPCQLYFPVPTRNAFITPVVLPFANPANNFQQCWGAKPAPWQCGAPNPTLPGTDYGNYPNAYVGAYIEFPTGSLAALQADAKSTAARDAIIAVMEEFVYNVVVNMLGLGTSMNARCGFPNQMVFGCPDKRGSKVIRRNNPQLNFGVAPDGKVRLLIIFMVDWNVIISKGRIRTFAQYESTVRSFFTTSTVAPLWAAAVSSVGPGRSQFLGGGSRRALGEDTGEEQEEQEEMGSLRKLPAVKRPPPKVTGSMVVKVTTLGSSK